MKPWPKLRERSRQPVTLAEQMFAWVALRNGDSVNQISSDLLRTAPEAREILWGKNER